MRATPLLALLLLAGCQVEKQKSPEPIPEKIGVMVTLLPNDVEMPTLSFRQAIVNAGGAIPSYVKYSVSSARIALPSDTVLILPDETKQLVVPENTTLVAEVEIFVQDIDAEKVLKTGKTDQSKRIVRQEFVALRGSNTWTIGVHL